MGDQIEIIDVARVEADAVAVNHKAVVTAINQLAANQKAIAEAAGVIKAEEPCAPPTGDDLPDSPGEGESEE